MYFIRHCLCRRMLGENPGLIANLALAVRRSNHSARHHPHSARSHPHSARPHPNLPRPHPHRVIFPWTIFPLFRRRAPAVFPQKELKAFHCTFVLRPFTPDRPLFEAIYPFLGFCTCWTNFISAKSRILWSERKKFNF